MAIGNLTQELAKLDQTEINGISSLGIREQLTMKVIKDHMDANPPPASDPAEAIAAAASKTPPIDADSVCLVDSAAANVLKRLTWANLKAALNAAVMTWTGKQTFNGTADLKGRGPTVFADDGYIGELETGDCSVTVAQNTTSLSTEPFPTITITSGHWLIVTEITATVGTTTADVTVGGWIGMPGSETFFPLLPTVVVGIQAQTYTFTQQLTLPANYAVGISLRRVQVVHTGNARTFTVKICAIRYA